MQISLRMTQILKMKNLKTWPYLLHPLEERKYLGADEFFDRFRLSKNTVRFIVDLIGNHLKS